MKKLFSSQDAFELQAVRSELDALSIPYMVKNEFASGAIGELPWQDSQVELWLVDESWYARASKVVEALIQKASDGKASSDVDWFCQHCGEENGGSFEICWSCNEAK
ncbi:putative signal transducing protein [Alteromonas sp. S167]|uniref:putative signal transducing protein n=1 Tax=Alteromonas sp. S167 TaxID=3117402 RepID=UPI002FE3AFE0